MAQDSLKLTPAQTSDVEAVSEKLLTDVADWVIADQASLSRDMV